jgi:uncharacterized membrane protein YidH (DUF202 family)
MSRACHDVGTLGRMIQSLLFGAFGVIAGLAFTVFGTRIARVLRASQTRAFGAAAGRVVTPTFIQVIGIFFVMVGGFMVFLALTGRG